jgi:hypothetical protein
MAKLGETLSTANVSVEGEADQPLGGVLTTKKIRIVDGSYAFLGPMLSTQELWAGGGPEMALARRGSAAEIWLPSSPPASCTKNDWTSLGTPANDFILSQVLLSGIFFANIHSWVEIRSGAAQANARDILYGCVPTSDPTSDSTSYWGAGSGLRPVTIPAGEEVWVYTGTNYPSDPGFEVTLLGWDSALPTFESLGKNNVVGPGRCYPNNTGTALSVAPGVFPDWGSTYEVVASAPNDFIVTSVYRGLESTGALLNPMVLYQLGVGPSGSEVWGAVSMIGHENQPWTFWPPLWVKAGERLAIRAMGSSTTAMRVRIKVYDL